MASKIMRTLIVNVLEFLVRPLLKVGEGF
jgi:hypothetical protein